LKILGIDPGSHITGYGVIEKKKDQWIPLTYGCLRTNSNSPLSNRLLEIYQGLSSIIAESKPNVLSIENVFFSKNANSALKLGHSRGVLILAAIQAGLSLYEYTPLQIKQAVTSYGQASKEQVQAMIMKLLRLKEKPPLDASDALAVALCHAHTNTNLQGMRASA